MAESKAQEEVEENGQAAGGEVEGGECCSPRLASISDPVTR